MLMALYFRLGKDESFMRFILCLVLLSVVMGCGGTTDVEVVQSPSPSSPNNPTPTEPEPTPEPTVYLSLLDATDENSNVIALVSGLQDATGTSYINLADVTKSSDTTNVTVGGTATTILDGVKLSTLLNGNYEYLASTQEFSFTADTASHTGYALVGVQTSDHDIPTSRTATYYGEAHALLTDLHGAYEMLNGTSSVQATFTSSGYEVDATLYDFTINNTSLSSDAIPADTIHISQMSGTDASFSGGVVSFEKDNASVDVIGDTLDGTSRGAFFGFDEATNTPAEIAGMHYVKGTLGNVDVVFTGR